MVNEEEISPPLAYNPDIATGIWSLHIAPKLKHFLWRIASKAIGVAENLRRRNMAVNPYCCWCCSETETSDHVLFSCPRAVSVWRLTGIPTNSLCDPTLTLEDKIMYLLTFYKDSHTDELIRYLPFWALWRIWKSRNDLLFNRRVIDPTETLKQSTLDAQEWLTNVVTKADAQQLNQGPQVGHRRDQRWQKQPQDWVKCNHDASHHEGESDSGLGWIIQNNQGTVLDCGMGKYQGRMTTEEAECTALIWAIQAACGLGYKTVIFEGDNLSVTRLITTNQTNPRLYHYLETIRQCRNMFTDIQFSFTHREQNKCVSIRQWRNMFTDIQFSFTHREQNKCADTLAKKAAICPQHWRLYHYCPLFLLSVVHNDYGFMN